VSRRNTKVFRLFLKCVKFHGFVEDCFKLEVSQPRISRRRTQFCNEKQTGLRLPAHSTFLRTYIIASQIGKSSPNFPVGKLQVSGATGTKNWRIQSFESFIFTTFSSSNSNHCLVNYAKSRTAPRRERSLQSKICSFIDPRHSLTGLVKTCGLKKYWCFRFLRV